MEVVEATRHSPTLRPPLHSTFTSTTTSATMLAHTITPPAAGETRAALTATATTTTRTAASRSWPTWRPAPTASTPRHPIQPAISTSCPTTRPTSCRPQGEFLLNYFLKSFSECNDVPRWLVDVPRWLFWTSNGRMAAWMMFGNYFCDFWGIERSNRPLISRGDGERVRDLRDEKIINRRRKKKCFGTARGCGDQGSRELI